MKDEKQLESSDFEKMARLLQEKQAEKIAACQRELAAVMERYGVTLQVVQVAIDGQAMKPEIRIIAAPKAG